MSSQEEEDLQAVQRGLDDMKAGRGRPMDEVFDELDAKYLGISTGPARVGAQEDQCA